MKITALRKTWFSGASLAAVLLVSGLSPVEARAIAEDRTAARAEQPRDATAQTGARTDAQTRTGTQTADRDQDRTAGEAVGDAWITTKVNSKLAVDGDVSVFDISVETRNNVVHLSGEVENQAHIDQAVRLARETEGVTRVEASGLRIGTGDGQTRDRDATGTDRDRGQTGARTDARTTGAAATTGTGTAAGDARTTGTGTGTEARDRTTTRTADRDEGRTAGEAVGDAWITTKVNSKLAVDGDVSVFDISVETRDNVVHLSGEVENQAQIDQAVRLARETEGVTRVEASGLRIGTGQTRDRDATGTDRDRGQTGARTDARTTQARDDRETRTGAATPGARTGTTGTADRDRTADRDDRRGAGEAVGDGWITTKVNSKLAVDGDVSVFDISVETRDNVVHLSGEVENQAQIDQAVRLAAETEGVTRVDASALRIGGN